MKKTFVFLLLLTVGYVAFAQNQKQYLFEIGFAEHKDFGIVSQTVNYNFSRITILRVTSVIANDDSLLYNFGFKFYEHRIPCNTQGEFSDIINLAEQLSMELHRKGYGMGMMMYNIIVDDGISATVYLLHGAGFIDANASLYIIADKKPF